VSDLVDELSLYRSKSTFNSRWVPFNRFCFKGIAEGTITSPSIVIASPFSPESPAILKFLFQTYQKISGTSLNPKWSLTTSKDDLEEAQGVSVYLGYFGRTLKDSSRNFKAPLKGPWISRMSWNLTRISWKCQRLNTENFQLRIFETHPQKDGETEIHQEPFEEKEKMEKQLGYSIQIFTGLFQS